MEHIIRYISHASYYLFKSSSDHFIFEITVGKSWIRHRMTLNLIDAIYNRFWVDLEIKFLSRSMSGPTLSDIYFKNIMVWVWTTLKYLKPILSNSITYSNNETNVPSFFINL